MKQVFKQREDGTIDFLDSIVVEEIPSGYVEIPREDNGKYNDEGRKLTEEELEEIKSRPPEKTELELLQEGLQNAVAKGWITQEQADEIKGV